MFRHRCTCLGDLPGFVTGPDKPSTAAPCRSEFPVGSDCCLGALASRPTGLLWRCALPEAGLIFDCPLTALAQDDEGGPTGRSGSRLRAAGLNPVESREVLAFCTAIHNRESTSLDLLIGLLDARPYRYRMTPVRKIPLLRLAKLGFRDQFAGDRHHSHTLLATRGPTVLNKRYRIPGPLKSLPVGVVTGFTRRCTATDEEVAELLASGRPANRHRRVTTGLSMVSIQGTLS
jgi:hypothetical protein